MEPLTEFQKFVASTSGQILPIYGAALFGKVPSTFAPLDMSPVPSDFVVGPGDELRIRIWGQVSLQVNARVDRSGEIYIPHVGPMHVAGLTFAALEGHLRESIGRVYRNFDLTVDMGKIRAIQVYVAGQARRPGVYTVSSLSTLVDALFASGGPSLQGSLRHIQVRRGGKVTTDFDLYSLLTNGDKSKDITLQAGDVVFIPAVGPLVALTGSVRNPAIYELRANESLADLLEDSGGVSAVAAAARISIERIEEHRDRRSMEVAYDQGGLATPLADGDLVHVYSIVPTYRKTVILRGNTANPGRFAWHPGMRVSELIPDRDSLITRNYWWKRTQLGLPAPEFDPVPGFSRLRQPQDNQPLTLKPGAPRQPNFQNQTLNQQDQKGNQNQAGYPPLMASELDQMPNQQDNAQQLSDAGTQYGQSSQNPQAQQQPGSSDSLAAAQVNQATRSMRNETQVQRTETKILAPEIDWDYASIERLDPETLKTTLIPFDLGKLVIQHDASQDLALQAGDVVSIFSDADIRVPIAQQTKLVKLEGEFVHAGTYSATPGETLQQLVERAGGFTSEAYVYGSEFTRETTRVIQQSRIDEYVRSLDMQIQRSNLAVGATPVTSAQDQLLARLRQIRATGRIVLEFKPAAIGMGDIPHIGLEDGDRFVVPSAPASVNVVGAVYDQNSFLHKPGRRVSDYLRLAGGPNRNADRRHAFVIRADGEVLSRESAKGTWGNEFNRLRLNPGDTIVVPDKTYKTSALRGILDWSQLFSQLALGAAAIRVL